MGVGVGVGDGVGKLVNVVDVGIAVGSSVGAAVGTLVGAAVGTAVGVAVGGAVGSAVGVAVGGKGVSVQHTLSLLVLHDSLPLELLFQYTFLVFLCRQQPFGFFFEFCSTTFETFKPNPSTARRQAAFVLM